MSIYSRVFFIDRKIKTAGKCATDDVIKEFEVTRRTVLNDIQFLRYELDAPIVFSKNKKGYVYQYDFDLLSFNGEESYLTYLFIKGLNNSPLFPVSLNCILNSLENRIPRGYRCEKKIIEFESQKITDFKVFKTIIDCIGNNKKCVIFLRNSEDCPLTILPIKIKNNKGIWSVMAFVSNNRSRYYFYELTDITEAKAVNSYVS
ncbi:MAG: HTH domain-containing protein [Spirochaetes bacterium]|nr:HTH domain-containing protein [Spirochaetota bacterium]